MILTCIFSECRFINMPAKISRNPLVYIAPNIAPNIQGQSYLHAPNNTGVMLIFKQNNFIHIFIHQNLLNMKGIGLKRGLGMNRIGNC